MYLVVGKNSKIVKDIAKLLPKFEFVSHKNILSVDEKRYERIFVFSWSNLSQKDNKNLIGIFDCQKIIFISTIAVLACARRSQWANYPNWKLDIETQILNKGGKVIRIGIWDKAVLDGLSGVVPITTPESLIKSMYDSIHSTKQIFWPIELQNGNLSGYRKYLSKKLNHLSLICPPKKIFQAPIALLVKTFLSKDYGYTHDCLAFFSDRILVGYGVLGSEISKALKSRGLSHSVIVSKDDNLFLTQNGFQGLRIGQFREGLARFWHGAWVSTEQKQYPRKNVPVIVKRPKLPRSALEATVQGIEFGANEHKVQIACNLIKDLSCFTKNIHLAAGVINNIKILLSYNEIIGCFSDHELCVLGEIKTRDLIRLGVLSKKYCFIFGRNVIRGEYQSLEYMIDFRPKIKNMRISENENIYNNRVSQIIINLVKKSSFSLINQAIFNKFGISLNVDDFSVVLQIDAHQSITLSKDGTLKRIRLPSKIFDFISEVVANQFPTFKRVENFSSFDAIHIHGGFDLGRYPEIKKLMRHGSLFLHGNVFDGSKLGPYHNTVPMLERELLKIEEI